MSKLKAKLFLDLGGGPEDCTILAGTGRSGTTWVGDIINYRNEYRTLFEPFWKKRVPLVAHFRGRQYLAPECTDPRYLEPARQILSGRIRNPFADELNTRWIARRRLLKDIRIALLLGWMKRQFPRTPIILLLRHPCAVAASSVKLGWGAPLREFLEQPDLIEAHLAPQRDLIEQIRDVGSEFEKWVVLWCVENHVALASGIEQVIHYENLCREDPRPEIARLFGFLGKPFDESVFEAMRRPSKLARTKSAIHTGASLVESWRSSVSSEQIDRTLDLLGAFGLDRIYDGGSYPRDRR